MESVSSPHACPGGAEEAHVINARQTFASPGPPIPTNPDASSYLTLATNGEAEATFGVIDGGKTAVYMRRWVAPGGVVGPWSDVVTATVAA